MNTYTDRQRMDDLRQNIFPPIMSQEDIDREERIRQLDRTLAILKTVNRALAIAGVAILVSLVVSAII